MGTQINSRSLTIHGLKEYSKNNKSIYFFTFDGRLFKYNFEFVSYNDDIFIRDTIVSIEVYSCKDTIVLYKTEGFRNLGQLYDKMVGQGHFFTNDSFFSAYLKQRLPIIEAKHPERVKNIYDNYPDLLI